MNKEDFTKQLSAMAKLIRTEFSLTQDEMSLILGISKKTLVETEKGRRLLSWTEAVALVSIFSQSHVIQNAFGGDVYDMIHAIAFDNCKVDYPDTMGGKVWWKKIQESEGYIIQQNIISGHYRLLNEKMQRMYSSFHLVEVEDYLTAVLARKPH